MIAFFSDIHGNSIALDQFLKYIKRFEEVSELYFLGDAINYYPDSVQVLERLKENKVNCILGNHEVFLFENRSFSIEKDQVYGFSKMKDKLTEEHIDYIKSWKQQIRFKHNGKRFLLVHGNPIDSQNGYVFPDSDLSIFKDMDFDVLICGHSHHSFIRKEYGKVFINVGSVGLPRDRGDYISFGLYDDINGEFKVQRIKMDLNKIISSFGSKVHSSVLKLLERTEKEIEKEIIISI